MQETVFSILRNTVNLLIVDDLHDMKTVIQENLRPFEIYSITTANSTREALDCVRKSKRRFHVCLFDLGLNDMENNEFYLLDKFSRDIPFVILSGQENPEKSFHAKRYGAKDYVRKGSEGFVGRIIASMNRQAMENMICPNIPESRDDPLFKCVEVLKNDMPARIIDWARQLNITDRQLRYEWEEHLGFSPKHSLCIYHLFSGLFKQVEIMCAGERDRSSLEHCSDSLLESISYKRFVDYYLVNKSSIMACLNKMPSLSK